MKSRAVGLAASWSTSLSILARGVSWHAGEDRSSSPRRFRLRRRGKFAGDLDVQGAASPEVVDEEVELADRLLVLLKLDAVGTQRVGVACPSQAAMRASKCLLRLA